MSHQQGSTSNGDTIGNSSWGRYGDIRHELNEQFREKQKLAIPFIDLSQPESPIPSYAGSEVSEISPISSQSSAASRGSNHHGNSEIDLFKSEIDIYRETGAERRALSLLDEAIGGVAPYPQSLERVSGCLTTRQAVILEHQRRCHEKAVVDGQMKADREVYAKRLPTLVAKKRKELLAESSRPPKPKTPEDVKDPETIAGMKCQLDIDREKAAQARALSLLEYGYLF